MSIPDYNELKEFPLEQIQNELFSLRKTLFDLKMKRATKRTFQSHVFQQTKHRIAQLKFKESQSVKILKENVLIGDVQKERKN